MTAPRAALPTGPVPPSPAVAVAGHRARPSRRGSARGLVGVLVALLLSACGGAEPLAFKVLHVPVAHDGFEVRDALPLRLRGDDPGHDLVVATENDLRFLRRYQLHWRDESAGTGLTGLAPTTRLDGVGADGHDLRLERPDGPALLSYSGIGSWAAAEGDVPARPEGQATAVRADLDGDGHADRAWIAERRVHVALADGAGGEQDVSTAVGSDALALPGDGTRLHAADLDGDGDLDLLVVGGRLFALLNNGGRWERPAEARVAGLAGSAPGPVARAAAAPTPAPAAGATTAARPGADDEPVPTAVPRPWFSDVTAAAGLAHVHREGGEQWDIRPTMGPGAAFADVDGDADPDLYVVGGTEQAGRLFLNDGQGHFADGSRDWGLPGPGRAGMGALFADLDDDGDPDLYLTHDGPNQLLRHDGDRFTDVTEAAGVGEAGWGASVAAADIDRDGDLDLFVTNYLEFDLGLIPPESERASQRREDPIAMLPYVFPGQVNALYRNDGDLRFTDVTEAQGLANPDGKSLGAVFLDHDDDGWPDLYVANDTTPNTFFHNQQGQGFEEVSLFVGLDDPRGGMGLAVADLDADHDEDLLLTNWQLEPNALYRNNHVHGETGRRFMPAFEDIAVPAGLAQPSVGSVGWGCVLADLDGDGDHDAFVANGYTSPDYETTMICVGQPDQLFANTAGPGPFEQHRQHARFAPVDVAAAGPHFARALPSRGVAAADVDGDGDLDLAVTANNGPLVLLRNERGGRFLHVVPRGTGEGVSADAVGARVTVELSDGSRRSATVRAGAGYLGGHERGVRFGLADLDVTGLEVAWPDDSRSRHAVDGPGRVAITQPAD